MARVSIASGATTVCRPLLRFCSEALPSLTGLIRRQTTSVFGDNDSKGWKRVKGNPNAKYYVKSWSQVKSKGYPQKKEKKILNDRKKWEGDRKATDGQEKAKEMDKQVEGEGAKKNEGDDQPFGKEFDKFVSLD